MGAWSFAHTSYFFRATGHPWLWQAVHWHCSVHPFFVFTHVDGVATQEGEGRVSEPWGESGGKSTWGWARGKSGESHTGQGKVRGMPGASQGKVRGTLAPKP